jgi:hypothetical protein
MVRSVVRAILALLLIGTFGARVATPGASWTCAMPDGGGHEMHGHHSGDQHHPVPGDDASGCECLAHSSAVANFSAPAGPAPAQESIRLVAIPAGAARATDPLPPHFLPFAHAPPVPLG